MATNINLLVTNFYNNEFTSEARKVLLEAGVKTYKRMYHKDLKYDSYSFSNVRIYKVYNCNTNGTQANFDLIVAGRVIFDHGYDIGDYFGYLQCEMIINEKFHVVKFVGRSTYPICMRMLENGIRTDGNLIPKICDEKKIATNFLKRYFPDALFHSMAVPIKRIAENSLELVIDETHELEETITKRGMICFEDDIQILHDGCVKVKANTVLIDNRVKSEFGNGCYNYTIGHECVHSEAHKPYLWLRKFVKDLKPSIIDISDKQIEFIEKQAERITEYILMPDGCAYYYLSELYHKYNYLYTEDKQKAMYYIISDMAKNYCVSKQAAAYKIKHLGFLLFDIDPSTINNTYIDETMIKRTYKNDPIFKWVIDSKKFVKYGNQYIFNDEKYIKNNRITTYALSHKDECFIQFTINTSGRYRYSNTLDRKKNLEEVRVDLKHSDKPLNKANIDFDKIDMEDEYAVCLADDIGITMKNIRLFKKYSYGQACLYTGVKYETLKSIEENMVETYNPATILQMCHGYGLPKMTTWKILSKITSNLDDTWAHRMVLEVWDEHYKEDHEVFKQTLKDALETGAYIVKRTAEIEKAKKEKVKKERAVFSKV